MADLAGLADLIGDDTNDESDTFKELISDLSDFHPELLTDFENSALAEVEVKQEDLKPDYLLDPMKGQSMNPFGNGMNELSPAAQTLKHMAEQHQHKSAMGVNYFQNQFNAHQVRPNGEFTDIYSSCGFPARLPALQ